jgi:hypothetical protein
VRFDRVLRIPLQTSRMTPRATAVVISIATLASTLAALGVAARRQGE